VEGLSRRAAAPNIAAETGDASGVHIFSKNLLAVATK
jgi:hypothetical protein